MHHILRSIPGTTLLATAAYTAGVFLLWALNLMLESVSLPAFRYPEAIAVAFGAIALRLLVRDMPLWQVIVANVAALIVGYAAHQVIFSGNAIYQLAPQVLTVSLAYWITLYIVTWTLRSHTLSKKPS
jgi:hypothetical protein